MCKIHTHKDKSSVTGENRKQRTEDARCVSRRRRRTGGSERGGAGRERDTTQTEHILKPKEKEGRLRPV